ncbi:hypothetical protein [Caulobacter sp. DWP3-1-3b2]|uniref:hypothetical protein n=1 Tax=Caulobacter sp. DWP3-1-3b2 TaxID=2804643 RepID=UPI003CF84C32
MNTGIVRGNRVESNDFSGVTNLESLATGSGSLVYDLDWIAYTPTVTAQTGTITTVSVATNAAFRRQGTAIQWRAFVKITTNGTGAGAIKVSLPASGKSITNGGSVAGRENAITGLSVAGYFSDFTAQIFFYDNTYPGGNGREFALSGLYERVAA